MNPVYRTIRRMVDARKIILDRLEERGLTRSDLVQLVKGKVPRTTVYSFLDGTYPLNHVALGHLLTALALTIKPENR
jgi:hypothetical protein